MASPVISVTNEREIQPFQLSIEQLSALKTQHEEELQELQKQMESLYDANSRFSNARSTLADISTCNDSSRILIPLNSSLYVPGVIQQPEKVIVELGTGYFCEKTIPAATDLIDRKVQLVKKSIESVEGIAIKKKRTLDQLVQIMQYKISQMSGKRHFWELRSGVATRMWSNVFNTKNRFDKTSFEQFQVTDLREENSELRRQITSLYSQLLNSDSLRDTTNMSTSTSTKSSRHASREFNNSYSKIAITEEYRNPMSIAEESILGLERELETHKAYIKEQANVAKELERKCQQKDEELLRLSLEVVQSIPLKTRIKELKKTNDDLNQTIGQLRAECSTLHTQIQELQEDREKQDSIIQQQEKEITCLGEKCSTAESEFQGDENDNSLHTISYILLNEFHSILFDRMPAQSIAGVGISTQGWRS
eukprot:gene23689-30721_t